MKNKTLTMQELPLRDRPYEKLDMLGPRALTEAELLAIIICTGYKGTTSLDISHKILSEYPQLKDLAKLSMEELLEFTGIGRAKALRILAAIELGRRAEHQQKSQVNPFILSSTDAIDLMENDLKYLEQEEVHALLLDNKGKLIRSVKISAGGLNQAVLKPRDVFRHAVRANAAALILCHNHPSGDPTPSPADIEATKRIKDVGEQMGIQVLDHIVIGHNHSVSIFGLGDLGY